MVMPQEEPSPRLAGARYLDAPAPIHFPVSAEVPESLRHLELRTVLYQLLRAALPGALVGSDQFVYYDASDPKRCVAPDVYVRFHAEADWVTSWKVWERGAPEIAVEVVSEFDRSEKTFLRRFEHYQRMGVRELLRFDPDCAGQPLRIWDRVQGSLTEREVSGQFAASSTCDLYWAIAPVWKVPVGLRIATGPSLAELVPTDAEAREQESVARRQEAEARQQEAEARQQEAEARQQEAEARRAAEARILELEAELKRRS